MVFQTFQQDQFWSYQLALNFTEQMCPILLIMTSQSMLYKFSLQVYVPFLKTKRQEFLLTSTQAFSCFGWLSLFCNEKYDSDPQPHMLDLDPACTANTDDNTRIQIILMTHSLLILIYCLPSLTVFKYSCLYFLKLAFLQLFKKLKN